MNKYILPFRIVACDFLITAGKKQTLFIKHHEKINVWGEITTSLKFGNYVYRRLETGNKQWCHV